MIYYTGSKTLLKDIAEIIARKTTKAEKCEVCNNTENIIRHHHNYYKYKDIIPLCLTCHSNIHSFDSIGRGFKKYTIILTGQEQKLLYKILFESRNDS